MGIIYPILNISISEWNNDIIEEIFRENDIYYSSNEEFFNTYLLNNEFIDCNGDIYKITGKIAIKGFWTLLFTSKRSRLIFEKTNSKITFDELQKIMVDRINDLKGDEAEQQWILSLKKAQTIKQLLE